MKADFEPVTQKCGHIAKIRSPFPEHAAERRASFEREDCTECLVAAGLCLACKQPGTARDEYAGHPFCELHYKRMKDADEATKKKREDLAALEHEQWAHWTRYMLDNLTPENIERWKRQCATPYEGLTEKEKNSDREWADKALKLIWGA